MYRAQFIAMMRAFHADAECRIQIAEFSIQSEHGFWRRKRRISKELFHSTVPLVVISGFPATGKVSTTNRVKGRMTQIRAQKTGAYTFQTAHPFYFRFRRK